MYTAPNSYRIIGPILLASTAATAQPVRYDFSEVTRLAQGAITGKTVETPVPGFELLLMKDGRTVYRRAFGKWSLGQVAAADSATKTLSGALIMSLADASPSPFSLDTRLSEYIPEFAGLRSTITIRQCFSHTSGLRDSSAANDPRLTLQEAAIEIAAQPLRYVPGNVFDYGGTSMQAAGAVAELAGAAPWNTLFEQRITGPLGMTNTSFYLTTPANPRVAGGCESTATEFAAFMEMLRRRGLHNDTRILSEDAVAQLLTRQTALDVTIAHSPLEGSADYGVGIWLDQRDAEGNLVGAIAAGARGFSSWIDLDDGMTGAFATDLTMGQNIRAVVDLIRAAAQDAIRNPLPCTANINSDDTLNSQDYFDFLTAFFANDADFNTDGVTNSQDFFDFLRAFFIGCD